MRSFGSSNFISRFDAAYRDWETKVLAIVGVFPFLETALATFLSLERSFGDEKFGCALHHLANRDGVHFKETKPDICWQLPLRRSWESREEGDTNLTVVVIGEYTRKAWGAGGEDLDWYCTSNSEAHTSSVPVYISQKTELIAMMNEKAYEILKNKCDLVVKAQQNRKFRSLPLFVLHPASR